MAFLVNMTAQILLRSLIICLLLASNPQNIIIKIVRSKVWCRVYTYMTVPLRISIEFL